MQQYEVAVIYDPGLEVDLSKAEERVKKIFADNTCSIKATDNWGKKKLAYAIGKHEYGIYVFYTVEMPAEALKKVEGMFNITNEVIRYLITRIDAKQIAKAEAAKQAKEEKEAKRAEHVKQQDAEEADEKE